MVEMAMFNVQRVITPKVGKPELRFMCSTHRLVVLYIGVKFRETITICIRLMERRRNCEALTNGQTDGRICSNEWVLMWLSRVILI